MTHDRVVGVALLAAVLMGGCSGSRAVPPVSAGAEVPATGRLHASNDTPRGSTYRILHSFGSTGSGDGTYPGPGLIDVNGTLYGSANGGGKYNSGVIYSIRPTGAEKVVYSFGASADDGSAPGPASALLEVKGTLYGTTFFGGKYKTAKFAGGGTVYKIGRTGIEKVLYSFDRKHDGGFFPQAALIDMNGTLYGTTGSGGKYDDATTTHGGTVFSISRKTGTERILHSFGKGRDGRAPWCTLVDVNGILYGVTLGGGSPPAASNGTVFSISPAGSYRLLHNFNSTDGGSPYDTSGLINVNGTLYGTTVYGGTYNLGTVFSISLTGTERVLHSFGSGGAHPDGTQPKAGLIYVNGTLYGTTSAGGKYNNGTVFRISLTGTEQVLHSFGHGSDGREPQGALLDVNGTLYGVTTGGGKNAYGSVFALTLPQ